MTKEFIGIKTYHEDKKIILFLSEYVNKKIKINFAYFDLFPQYF